MWIVRISTVHYMRSHCRHFSSRNERPGQIKALQKLFDKHLSKRKPFTPLINISPATINNEPKKEISNRRSRRMAILDKLFMRHISDLMATGEECMVLSNRGVEISYVKVMPDYNLVNVYWIADERDQEVYEIPTEELLSNYARSLRHELCKLRIMGVVPPIQFVKEKAYFFAREMEKRMAIINRANEAESSYDPWELVENFLPSKSCKMHANLSTSDRPSKELEVDLFQETFPEMTNNVFGLDHHRVMTKIKVSLQKVKKAAGKDQQVSRGNYQCTLADQEQNRAAFLTMLNEKRRDEMFTQYLAKRKLDAKRKYKQKRNSEVLIMYEDNANADEIDLEPDILEEEDL